MSLMSDIGAAIKNKLMVNDFASQSSNLLTGGGTVSVSAALEVKWSIRFITIGNGRGSGLSTSGYFNIDMPADGTVITGIGGATNKTVTANGIPIATWETLYYILPVGGGETTVNANFRVVNFTADVKIPSTWVKICSRNDDVSSYIDFACGVSLRNNTSINTNLYDVKGTDVDGAVSSAIKAAAFTTAVGSAPSYACRAWVNFNGSGTVAIRASGNVSSITDNGVGNYTVNFTTAMPDYNYSIAGIASVTGLGGVNSPLVLAEGLAASNTYALKTTSAITVFTINNESDAAYDAFSANVSIFR